MNKKLKNNILSKINIIFLAVLEIIAGIVFLLLSNNICQSSIMESFGTTFLTSGLITLALQFVNHNDQKNFIDTFLVSLTSYFTIGYEFITKSFNEFAINLGMVKEIYVGNYSHQDFENLFKDLRNLDIKSNEKEISDFIDDIQKQFKIIEFLNFEFKDQFQILCLKDTIDNDQLNESRTAMYLLNRSIEYSKKFEKLEDVRERYICVLDVVKYFFSFCEHVMNALDQFKVSIEEKNKDIHAYCECVYRHSKKYEEEYTEYLISEQIEKDEDEMKEYQENMKKQK